MSDPRRAEVWGKKPEVADRTLNERKFCKVCEYYYSEMFTCPICYGEARAIEKIVDIVESLAYIDEDGDEMISEFKSDLIARIRKVSR